MAEARRDNRGVSAGTLFTASHTKNEENLQMANPGTMVGDEISGPGKVARGTKEHLPSNKLAQMDFAALQHHRQKYGLPGSCTRKDVTVTQKEWDAQKMRKIPDDKEVRFIPALLLRDKILRRAATRWYCGLFPKNPELFRKQLKSKGKRALERLRELMANPKWELTERREAVDILQFMKTNEPTAY